MQYTLEEYENKLNVANCNCQALEEENNDLHMLIKELQDKREIPHFDFPRPAVRVLIKEANEQKKEIEILQSNLLSLKRNLEEVCERLSEDTKRYEEHIIELEKENYRLEEELNNARLELTEATTVLEEERSARETSEVLWEQERKQYSEKIRELLSANTVQESIMNPYCYSSPSDGRSDIDVIISNNSLNVIQELKDRLFKAEKRVAELCAEKTVEMHPTNAADTSLLHASKKTSLGNEIAIKTENEENDGNIICDDHEERFVRSLQNEISKLNHELLLVRCDLVEEKEKSKLLLNANNYQRINSLAEIPAGLSNYVMSKSTPYEETNKFYSELHRFKTTILSLQSQLDEKEVYCKELEAKLACITSTYDNANYINSKNNMNTLKVSEQQFQPSTCKLCSEAETQVNRQEVNDVHDDVEQSNEQYKEEKQLSSTKREPQCEERSNISEIPREEMEFTYKKTIGKLNEEINRLIEANAQKDIINTERLKEMKSNTQDLQKKILEFKKETEILKTELAQKEEETKIVSVSPSSESLSTTAEKFMKSNKQCIEEVMDVLEMAWLDTEHVKDQLNHIPYETAILANQDVLREEEYCRLQKALEEAESKLKGTFANERKVDDLERVVHQRGNKIHDMKAVIDDYQHTEIKHKKEIESLRKKLNLLTNENNKLLQEKNASCERDVNTEAVKPVTNALENSKLKALEDELCELREKNLSMEHQLTALTTLSPSRSSRVSGQRATQSSFVQPTLIRRTLSLPSTHSSTEDIKRSAVPEGAHLTVTVAELSNILRNGKLVTEPGYVVIKLKSIKEKYKTSVKELSEVICFGETFVFYLAQPDQDVITLHVFYKAKNNSREFHVGDACFSMATLYRGIPRHRIAPVVQNPGTKDAMRAAQIDVVLQTDDFGRSITPSAADLEDEELKFDNMVRRFEAEAVEKLHAVDVYMASTEFD